MTAAPLDLQVADEDAMVALGAALGAVCEPPLVIFLEGELGMGKTTLARGVMRSHGHTGAVKSPTYTLVEPYDFDGTAFYHFDLYRLGDPEELEFMGIRDYFGDFSVCLVEWPERGRSALPPADLIINITLEGRGRRVRVSAGTIRGEAVLERMPA